VRRATITFTLKAIDVKEISAATFDVPEVTRLLEPFLVLLRDTIECERVLLVPCGEDVAELSSPNAITGPSDKTVLPRPLFSLDEDTSAGLCAKSRLPVVIQNAMFDRRFAGEPFLLQATSILCVPIIRAPPAEEIVAEKSLMAVGVRVSHQVHGAGTVTELMPDERTRVAFDKGEEHRYKPKALEKLNVLAPAEIAPLERNRATKLDSRNPVGRPSSQGSSLIPPLASPHWRAPRAKVIGVLKCLNKRGPLGSARAGYTFDGDSDVMTAQLIADQIALLASFGKRELSLLRNVQIRVRNRLARKAHARAQALLQLHAMNKGLHALTAHDAAMFADHLAQVATHSVGHAAYHAAHKVSHAVHSAAHAVDHAAHSAAHAVDHAAHVAAAHSTHKTGTTAPSIGRAPRPMATPPA